MPVSSFAPELLELFKRAAQEEVKLQIGDKKKALRLRFRFHNLRKQMRKEQHTLTTIANSVEFSIDKDFNLICSPADDSYLNCLHAAGIEVAAPSVTSAEPMQPVERADAEETLKKFLKGEE